MWIIITESYCIPTFCHTTLQFIFFPVARTLCLQHKFDHDFCFLNLFGSPLPAALILNHDCTLELPWWAFKKLTAQTFLPTMLSRVPDLISLGWRQGIYIWELPELGTLKCHIMIVATFLLSFLTTSYKLTLTFELFFEYVMFLHNSVFPYDSPSPWKALSCSVLLLILDKFFSVVPH